jgi:hypothetical protein
MSIITRLKQFISPTGEQAVNDVPAIVGDIWSRHSFTPVTNWPAAYAMWKANPYRARMHSGVFPHDARSTDRSYPAQW